MNECMNENNCCQDDCAKNKLISSYKVLKYIAGYIVLKIIAHTSKKENNNNNNNNNTCMKNEEYEQVDF